MLRFSVLIAAAFVTLCSLRALAFEAEVESPGELPLNRVASLTVHLRSGNEGPAPILASADADLRMPSHRHAALIRPRVTALGPDTLRIDGLLAHMAGDWVLTLRLLGSDGKPRTFTFPLRFALNLTASIPSLIFPPRVPPGAKERALAHLGREIFFDPRFSQNGQVACGTCHQPERSYTDGRTTAVGIGTVPRNTPTLVNVATGSWLFWDGRTDSLEAQALEPLLSPAEHGLDRAAVVRVLKEAYGHEYEELFGALPEIPDASVPEAPLAAPFLPDAVARAAVDSLAMPLKRALLATALGRQVPAHRIFLSELTFAPAPVRRAGDPGVDRALANVGRALAQFERGIVADESPFDAFAKRVGAGVAPAQALGPGFGARELAGLTLFAGKGRCILCHSGPSFTDQQFHNTGLPQRQVPYDLGRATGLLLARGSVFNCRGGLLPATDRESCRELPYLDGTAVQLLGAFKTPTLRNVAQTAPYGHDGRFATLDAVLAHYDELPDPAPTESVLGHREETLQPLHLPKSDLADLTAFLRSLTSPVRTLDSL